MGSNEIKKWNAKQWGAILIAALFGFSFIGFIGVGNSQNQVSSQSSEIEYNGFTFTYTNNYWATNVNGKDYYFLNPPTALETFTLPENIQITAPEGKIYVAYDPNQSIELSAIQSVAGFFFNNYNIAVFQACTTEEECPDIPIVDCTEDNAFIFIPDLNETKIEVDQLCTEIHSANTETMIRQLERILYSVLGVM